MKKINTTLIVAVSKTPAEQFTELVAKGMQAWVEAGRLLNQEVAKEPRFRAEIMDANPWMTLEVIYTFERIGKRELFPQLMLDCSPGAKRLVRLPYDAQERYFAAQIEVAVVGEMGQIEVAQKRLQDLTADEANRAFGDVEYRSIELQKESLADKMALRRANRLTRTISKGNIDGSPDELETEDLDAESKKLPENIDEALRAAQSMLLLARQLLTAGNAPENLDGYVTAALKPIGTLRFMLGGDAA